MTELQKSAINDMRTKNISYAEIAEKLGISVNTVKSYCRRNGLGTHELTESIVFCLNCGAVIPDAKSRNRRKFCSAKCKTEWWNKHRYERKSPNIREYTCAVCGRKFYDYAGTNRKYCSRDCFRKRGAVNGR